MFCTVSLALWGLPYYYDFMVRQFGWTRSQVTSGNAIKQTLNRSGIRLSGGLGDRSIRSAPRHDGWDSNGVHSTSRARHSFEFKNVLLLYILNALGFVCGGPLPNQVLLSECFEKSRGKAMGFAYLRIGIGGAMVPWISNILVQHLGWQAALRSVGLLILALAFPAAYSVKEPPASRISELPRSQSTRPPVSILKAFTTLPFYLLVIGSMCSVAAISGVQQNLKLFLVLDHQNAQSLAARFLSLVLTFSIVGRLTMEWLADRFHPKYVMGFDLFACRNRDSHRDIESVAFVSVRLLGCFWNWPGRRLHDHLLGDCRNLQHENVGTTIGRDPDRARCGRNRFRPG